ncbi:hypothetical protein KM043_000116, partial [Ampulex compressa]
IPAVATSDVSPQPVPGPGSSAPQTSSQQPDGGPAAPDAGKPQRHDYLELREYLANLENVRPNPEHFFPGGEVLRPRDDPG